MKNLNMERPIWWNLLQQKNLYVQALQGYIQAKYTAALNLEVYNFYRGEPVKL